MPPTLLETKLHAPRRRVGLVSRPRLNEQLSRGILSGLTLVSAPAGFGKTTLITEWLTARHDPPSAAWLSLDVGDNDPVAFWSYVIAAHRTRSPALGEGARALLDSPQAPIEGVLTGLLNDLSTLTLDIVLVLDDYHEIEAPEIHRAMAFLLDHRPPSVHLVISTRADPPLPLARLRARGELLEVRAADLRFTPGETAAYLGGTMGLAVTDRDIQALERRTEGWIAALQLAGLSMQGRDDLAGFIAGFTGDDRYIVDYLVEEVLQRQPDDVRDFLLQTSILSRLTGPLCDAVTGGADGRATLDALDRANLFVMPLDDHRRWYRYHHLFADVLRTRLLDQRPDVVPALHRRASEWHAREGDPSEAIHHAVAGGDPTTAADLIERAVPDMRRARQDLTLRGWLEALPRDLLKARPVLSLTYVGTLMQTGTLEDVDELLGAAEQWWEGRRPGMMVGEQTDLARVPVEIAMYRAAQALMLGDPAGTVVHAQRALDLSDADDHLGRGAGEALMGLAHWSSGDLASAERRYLEAGASLERAGFLSDVLGCAITLADLQFAQGRLEAAQRTYERGLDLAGNQGGPPLRGAADMHVGLGELARERNDLVRAAEHLARSRELGDENGLPQGAYRWRLLAARIRQADGDLDGALELVTEARRWRTTDMSPDVRPLAAVNARLWILRGDLTEARAWALTRGLSAADEPSYLREFELATLARLLVAEGLRDGADDLIDDAIRLARRLRSAAEEGRRHGSVLDILAVQALAHLARRDVTGALTSLTAALALAEPHGHARTFLDEGPPMTALLRLGAKQEGVGGYARALLAGAPGDIRSESRQGLIEPLSERELDVLRLLAGDLDGPAIANELIVSLSTIRSHTKSIYAKLGVNDRRGAVRRAGELGLLSPRRERHTTD